MIYYERFLKKWISQLLKNIEYLCWHRQICVINLSLIKNRFFYVEWTVCEFCINCRVSWCCELKYFPYLYCWLSLSLHLFCSHTLYLHVWYYIWHFRNTGCYLSSLQPALIYQQLGFDAVLCDFVDAWIHPLFPFWTKIVLSLTSLKHAVCKIVNCWWKMMLCFVQMNDSQSFRNTNVHDSFIFFFYSMSEIRTSCLFCLASQFSGKSTDVTGTISLLRVKRNSEVCRLSRGTGTHSYLLG